MRIICTLKNAKKAKELSLYLISKNIDNQLEVTKNQDWGSSEYGDTTCRIWIYDEDQLAESIKYVEQLELDPYRPNLLMTTGEQTQTDAINPSEILDKDVDESFLKTKTQSKSFFYTKNPLNDVCKATSQLILLCCLFFMLDVFFEPSVKAVPNYLPSTPLLASELKKNTLYDFPKAYMIVDELNNEYGIEKLLSPQTLPEAGKDLIVQFISTPYWRGIYDQVEHDEPINFNAPMFEKIRQGEFWRCLTPCFLHNDILHLLFNMLWLYVLGKQIELRLNTRRYFLFVCLVGAFSSTCQYLMSGPNFLGFSGVVCGMLTFIRVRQAIAPVESYPMEKGTFVFLGVFIIAMAIIQLFSFYLETHYHFSASPGIANTAHLAGAFIGALLGCLPFFSQKLNISGKSS